ncbi:MAG: hypothetical protein MUF52_02750 [Syntrophobacteraceae bacterium]|jgi:hypothetical protein|nr:hypothetical protein [Syntrophobacteraceae bacterium]
MVPRRFAKTLGAAVLLVHVGWTGWPGAGKGLAAEGVSPAPVAQAGEGASLASEGPVDCRELARLLEQQKGQLSRELGQIKRELGLLREDMARPGLKEIVAGIGYILGLAGVGLYIHSRKASRRP